MVALDSRVFGDDFSVYVLSLTVGPVAMVTKLYLITHAPFCKHSLILILAWITNFNRFKVWDEITYPFTNFIGGTVEVC